MPALTAVALGLLLGWLSGGQFRGLGELKLRGEMWILPCFVIQAIVRGRFVGSGGVAGWAVGVWIASSLLLAIGLLMNHRVAGALLCSIGVMANLIVVLLNGRMPVGSATAAGVVQAAGRVTALGFYGGVNPATLAGFAGDVMPLGIAGSVLMLSLGDVLLCVGVCTLIVAAMATPATAPLGLEH